MHSGGITMWVNFNSLLSSLHIHQIPLMLYLDQPICYTQAFFFSWRARDAKRDKLLVWLVPVLPCLFLPLTFCGDMYFCVVVFWPTLDNLMVFWDVCVSFNWMNLQISRTESERKAKGFMFWYTCTESWGGVSTRVRRGKRPQSVKKQQWQHNKGEIKAKLYQFSVTAKLEFWLCPWRHPPPPQVERESLTYRHHSHKLHLHVQHSWDQNVFESVTCMRWSSCQHCSLMALIRLCSSPAIGFSFH